MNSSTSIEAFVGEEAVMKCVTENLANNHLVRLVSVLYQDKLWRSTPGNVGIATFELNFTLT